MNVLAVVFAVAIVSLIVAALSIRVATQYEKCVLFRLGRVKDVREPGLRFIISVVDRFRKVPMRIVTMPIQSQGIITRDNVSVDIAAVAYFRVVDGHHGPQWDNKMLCGRRGFSGSHPHSCR